MLNENEVDRLVGICAEYAPDIERFAQFLADWKDIVNENSDGWIHWKPAYNASGRLQKLLSDSRISLIESRSLPDASEFVSSLIPIYKLADKHNLPKPKLQEVKAQQQFSPGI